MCTLISLLGCQQPRLNVREDDIAQAAPQEQTPQTKQGTEAPTTHKSSDVALTMSSASDSSPDTKHADTAVPDRDATAQSIVNLPQGNTLAFASADTIIPKSSDESVKKRSGQEDVVGKEQPAKRQKQEETTHKEWFMAFANTTKQIEEDLEDEAAWDNMAKLLNEGEKITS